VYLIRTGYRTSSRNGRHCLVMRLFGTGQHIHSRLFSNFISIGVPLRCCCRKTLLSKSPFLSLPDKQGGRKLDDGEERERDGSLDTAGMKLERELRPIGGLLPRWRGVFCCYSHSVCVCVLITQRGRGRRPNIGHETRSRSFIVEQ